MDNMAIPLERLHSPPAVIQVDVEALELGVARGGGLGARLEHMMPPEASWKPLGTLLEASWTLLGPSWTHLERILD